MKKAIATMLSIILLPAVICLASFATLVYNERLYISLLEETTEADIGLAQNTTAHLISYFKGETSLLPDMFTAEEKQHLADVKSVITIALLALVILSLIWALLFYCSYKATAFVYGAILAIIMPPTLYFIPFEPLFTLFHKMFFSAGSWTFPIGYTLVTIYTEQFFYLFAFRIFLQGMIAGLLLLAGYLIIRLKMHSSLNKPPLTMD